MTPRPKLLVIDVDVDAPLPFPGQANAAPRATLSANEAKALERAQNAGLDIAVLTAVAEETALRVFADAGLFVTVLESSAAGSLASVDSVLNLCHRRGYTLRDLAVIASRPNDIPLMLETGIAYALKGVGRAAESATDAVFPPRYQDGLATAIDAVVTLLD